MRRIAAKLAFTGTRYIQNPVIEISDSQEIMSVKSIDLSQNELPNCEYYSGLLLPGFINAHTHTELSVRGETYTSQGGMMDFVKHVISLRRNNKLPQASDLQTVYRRMKAEGTVAFADITNSEVSFHAKQKTELHHKSFFEFFPLSAKQAEAQRNVYSNVRRNFTDCEVFPSLHSPYALTMTGINSIKDLFNHSEFSSIHYRESEDELHLDSPDNPMHSFYRNIEPNYKAAFVNPLFSETLGDVLNHTKQLLLVHNTCIRQEDVDDILKWSHRHEVNLNFVLCPRSNMNINANLPDIHGLMQQNLNLCFGTDSLLSAPNLSIFEELKFVQANYPEIKLQSLLKMSAYNAAQALGWDELGELAVGKKPGINLISMKELHSDRLHPDAELNVIV